jgi:hypothetical protein
MVQRSGGTPYSAPQHTQVRPGPSSTLNDDLAGLVLVDGHDIIDATGLAHPEAEILTVGYDLTISDGAAGRTGSEPVRVTEPGRASGVPSTP